MGEVVVGRDDEIELALRALADPACDGVFLVADEPGAGATAVLDAVLARLDAQGRRTNRVVASRGASTSPYAALAHVLPLPLAPAGDLDPLVVFDRIRERVASLGGGGRRFVTAVDDIRWLDQHSLALLSTLLAGKLAVTLATLRASDPVPEAVAAVERSCAIRRIPIGRLARADADAYVAQLLPGPVDGTLTHELFASSRGNPLYLRETVAGGLATGAICHDDEVWTLAGRLLPTARLATVLDAELEGIDEPQRHVLELLAICEPLDIRALERLGLGDATVALDDRGLVGADEARGTVMVHVVQPLLAALLRTRLSPLRKRSRLRDAIGAMAAVAVPADQLRLARWKLDAGIDVPAGELIAAAQQARALPDVEAVRQLATAALTGGEASGDAHLLHAEALQSLGQFQAAEVSLAAAERLATDDRSRLAVALVRQRILLWSGIDAAATIPPLEAARAGLTHPVSRDLVLAAMASTEAIAGQAAACLALTGRLESGSDLAETAMAFPVAIAEARLGRPRRAAEIARAARERAGADVDAFGVGHAATLRFAEGLALIDLGRFGEAEDLLRAAYHQVVERRIPQYQAWVTSGLGRLALARGRPAEGARWFAECRAVSKRIAFEPGERAATAGLIVCAGLAGDMDRVLALAESAAARWPALHEVWPDGPVALAWAAVAAGDADPSHGLAAAASVAVAREELATASVFAHEAVRAGATELPDVVLAGLTRAEGDLVAARNAVVRGVCRDDIGELEAGERAFNALGVPFAAAEAAAQLSRRCLRLGRSRQSSAAAARADGYLAQAGGVRSPLVEQPSATYVLSPREAEIAALATAGLASKEIAVKLGLSVRTVSNHLQSVYTKLGVSGRDHLRELLAARNA